MLPNLLRRLFAEGAFNVAFVPLYMKEREKDPKKAQQFINTTLTWLVISLLFLTLLAEIFMPLLVGILAPGFLENSEKFNLTVFFARITFPYLMFISLASYLGALNNSVGKFMSFAMIPVILNITLITALLLHPALNISPALAATLTIPTTGVLQLLVMVHFFKKTGISLKFGNRKNAPETMGKFLRLLAPAAFGTGVLQISFLIDTMLASLLYDKAISYLQYANRFYQMPLSLIGTALATVLLPHFARAMSKQDITQVQATFQTALKGGLTLAFAATVGLVVLSHNLITTLLQHGAFTVEATAAVSWAMIGYSIGLPGYILTKITSTAFFASGDTKTPFKISLYALLVNVIANVILMQFLGHIGIALATACSGYTNAFLQWRALQRKNDIFNQGIPLFPILIQSTPTAICMACLLVIYQWFIAFPSSNIFQMIWLFGAIFIGLIIFVIFNYSYFLTIVEKFRKK